VVESHKVEVTNVSRVFLFIQFRGSDGNCFIEAEAGTVVSVGIHVCENRHKESGLLLFRRQHPPQGLAEKFYSINEWCVIPVLFWETLNDFAMTETSSCKEKIKLYSITIC